VDGTERLEGRKEGRKEERKRKKERKKERSRLIKERKGKESGQIEGI
jgi:hypothetical protein